MILKHLFFNSLNFKRCVVVCSAFLDISQYKVKVSKNFQRLLYCSIAIIIKPFPCNKMTVCEFRFVYTEFVARNLTALVRIFA